MIKQAFCIAAGLLLHLGAAQAQEPNWRYFTADPSMAAAFDTPIYSQGAQLCVIEGWTPENSGFPSAAPLWNTQIFPNTPSNPDALQVMLQSIDAQATGHCDFVGLPWYVPQFRQPFIDRLAQHAMTEIAGLSVPEGANPAAASAPSAELSAEAAAVGQQIETACARHPYQSLEFDCGCVANAITAGILGGTLSAKTDANTHIYQYFRSPPPTCVNDAGIRAAVVKFCENNNIFASSANPVDCQCAADVGVAAFRANPQPSKHLAFYPSLTQCR